MQQLLTIKDLARILNISIMEARRLVWAGEIQYINLNKGGRYIKARFTPEHINAYLRQREIKVG
ncbi:MAG: helix-turn-helix domain-containing protein [Limnochordia bacterium]